MLTRRTFLQSALLLPAALTHAARAQDAAPGTAPASAAIPAQAKPAAEVFADFEGGRYDGWTLEGDAFGSAPATDALFPGKIGGFAGRGFLCSLHPKKGNAAKGKATSREFTIEKPFITFKIGGGDHAGEACMNLVVDGQVVRTATGTDLPVLSDASWDVSALVGKKAHLEVVDSTSSAERGYILVDDIKFVPLIDFSNLPYQDVVMQMAERWRHDYGLPGVWCAFIKDGKVVACAADGVKNIETKAPASVDDHLNVGSVSKVITGSLIAEFVAKGTIKYETTVGEVFPELAKQYPNSPMLKSTLRSLLAHTSALTSAIVFDTRDKPAGVTWRAGHVPTAVSSSALREPETVYEYNNAGAVIATAMVERLTGSSYESWLYGSLGKRIGLSDPQMLNYSVLPSSKEVSPHYLGGGHAEVNLKLRRDNFKFAPQGSCSLILSDLCAFSQFTMTNTANLPPQVFYDIIHRPANGLKCDTSASWHIASMGYPFHDGNTGRGEFCSMQVDPRRKVALIFYTNANYSESNGGSSNQAFDVIGKEKLSLFLQRN